MPSYFPENNTALPFDNELRSLQKLVDLAGGGGGGGSTQVFHVVGSGAPLNTPTGAATAYNDAGNFFTWSGSVWNQQF